MKISLLGCGWLGLPLGCFLLEKGFSVKGSVTSSEKFHNLKENGIVPYRVLLSPHFEADHAVGFFDCDILVINFPPKRREDIEVYHPEQIKSLINEIVKYGVKKVLFVSSTSVYPDVNREVFEDEVIDPDKGSGKALKTAEELLQNESGFQTTVVRFAGLIGPGRLPGRFLAGKKDVANGDAPVNLIHRDDCIEIIFQVIRQEVWGEVFNACADEHPVRRVFYTRAALKIGLEAPEFAAERQTRFKLINSDKLKHKLGFRFSYPDPMQMLDD